MTLNLGGITQNFGLWVREFFFSLSVAIHTKAWRFSEGADTDVMSQSCLPVKSYRYMKNMISIPYNMDKHTKIKNKFTKAY